MADLSLIKPPIKTPNPVYTLLPQHYQPTPCGLVGNRNSPWVLPDRAPYTQYQGYMVSSTPGIFGRIFGVTRRTLLNWFLVMGPNEWYLALGLIWSFGESFLRTWKKYFIREGNSRPLYFFPLPAWR